MKRFLYKTKRLNHLTGAEVAVEKATAFEEKDKVSMKRKMRRLYERDVENKIFPPGQFDKLVKEEDVTRKQYALKK